MIKTIILRNKNKSVQNTTAPQGRQARERQRQTDREREREIERERKREDRE